MGGALSSRFAAAYKELQVEQDRGAVQQVQQQQLQQQQQQQLEPVNPPSSCLLRTRSFITNPRLIFIRVLVRMAVVATIIGLSKVFNYRKAVDEYVTSVVALGPVLSYAAFGGAALLFNTLSPTGYLSCVAPFLLPVLMFCSRECSTLLAGLTFGWWQVQTARVCCCCC
jgi:hypothetical protein